MDRLLIVDDDLDIREMLSEYLATEGYDVESVGTGLGVPDRATSGDYALIILDVMLPEANGLDVLRKIRTLSQVPVLMLTARGEIVDRVVGLRLGADDYLAKPFAPQELAARIAAILRRSQVDKNGAPSSIELGDVFLNTKSRVVTRAGRPIDLTTVEFDLLHLFVCHAGQTVSREVLQRRVLERNYTPLDRSIDTHVSNLRKKLGAFDAGVERIRAVRGTGYMYCDTAARRR
jgi:DNA-binding response OmpR family regulator